MTDDSAELDGAQAPNHQYWARFLGPFTILRDGEPFARGALARTGPRTLLKWFLLHPGTVISAGEAAALLWPDQQPSGPGRVHAALHHLRRVLEPDLAPRAASKHIRTNRKGSYWFDLADCWSTDLLEAERLVADADACEEAEDPDGAIAALERFVGLCTSIFLPEDLYSDDFQDVRAAHDVSLARVQARLLRLYMAQGLCHLALSFALSMQDRDPYSDAAALTVAQVHLRNGNPALAASQINEFVRLVQRDLGVLPDPQLLELREGIRRRTGSDQGSDGGRDGRP